MTNTLQNLAHILAEVERERVRQIEKWGVTADDAKNSPNDWVAYMAHHSTRWFSGSFPPHNRSTLEVFRQQMVKVATLAVAAIEWVDKILQGENIRPDVFDKTK